MRTLKGITIVNVNTYKYARINLTSAPKLEGVHMNSLSKEKLLDFVVNPYKIATGPIPDDIYFLIRKYKFKKELIYALL